MGEAAWAECELGAEWEEGWREAGEGDGRKEEKFRSVFSCVKEIVTSGRT